jgi:hypothetical protein
MNQIILTHPRSGSTAYSNQLVKSQPGMLDLKEFLNPYCPDTFGQIQRFLINSWFNRRISVTMLKRSRLNNNNADLTADMYLYKSMDVYFDDVMMQFMKTDNVLEFLKIEELFRIQFLKSIQHLDWSIKHFVSNAFFYNNLLIQLPNTTKIFYYRKDIIGSVLSSLIKTLYIDRNDLKLGSHNYVDNQIPTLLPNDNIKIENINQINKELEFIVNLLKFYKQYKSKLDKIVAYEDSILPQQSAVGNMLPMPYTCDKSAYFNNSNLVIECTHDQIAKHNLQDVVEELGIIT